MEPTKRVKRAQRLLNVLLLVGSIALHARGGALADQDFASPLDYARWAERALQDPPSAVRFVPDLETRLTELIGQKRSEQGRDLPALEFDPGLQRAARAHALDMLGRGYTGHVDPDGRDVSDRVALLHRRFVGGVGENLAELQGIPIESLTGQSGPLALKLTEGWMGSEGHRENILSPDYTYYGMAAAGEDERLVVVHVFGVRRALLEEPIPLTVRPGMELPLSFADGGEGKTPVRYGYAQWDRPADEIVPLDLSSNQVAMAPGTYRLMFLLPTGEDNVFEIAGGPAIVVQSSP